MEQKQQNSEEELTPEEREVLLKIQESWNSRIERVLGPIYNIFEWCWPATIALFAFQQLYALMTGTVPYSFWIVTVFLWIPFVLSLAVTALVVFLCYSLAFFSSWNKFLCSTILYFKLGLKEANKTKREEKTDKIDR